MTTKTEFPIIYLIEGEPSKWNSKPCSGQRIGHPISANQPYFTKQNRKWLNGIVENLCIAIDTAGKEYMGKKDLTGKDFFADRRRFAELFNAILYHGEDVIRAEEIEQKKESQAGNKMDYREKKSRMKETDVLLPVVTVVLYLGTDHWEGRRKLSELYCIPEDLQESLGQKLPDYGFSMAEADFINPDYFKTDLKEFFQAMQCRKDRGKLRELLMSESFQQLNEDALWAIAVHLDRNRLTAKIEKEGLSMCPALKEWAEEEREEGRKEGRKEERISIIKNMIREGMDYDMIHRIIKCSQKEFSLAAKS